MAVRPDAKPKPRMPADEEVRRSLVAAGMPEREATAAFSRWRRIPRLEFLRRWQNRMLNLVQERLVVVAAKRKLLEILDKEAHLGQKALNLEDLFTGVYQEQLGNFGEIVFRRAVEELSAEGVVTTRRGRGVPEIVGLTGRDPTWNAAKLRKVHEQMRAAMGVREARPYKPEKKWDL
jgi:hypothetical protein